jgi:hypothetical protein
MSEDAFISGVFDNRDDRPAQFSITVGDHHARLSLGLQGSTVRELNLEGAATTRATQGNPFPGKFFMIQTETGSTGRTFYNHQ